MLNAQCSATHAQWDLQMASACTFITDIHTVQAGAGVTHMQMMFFPKLVQWIREEFEARPELRLTTREAAAFLGLDLSTCERVLNELISVGFLARGADNRYRQVAPG
jgi:hypothetical protein